MERSYKSLEEHYKKDYDHNRWRNRRNEYLKLLGPCKNCGTTQKLEFHHRDPKDKLREIHWSWSTSKLKLELAKCDVLCHSCHLAIVPYVHGTHSCYCNANCRCIECVQAQSLYVKQRKMLNSI